MLHVQKGTGSCRAEVDTSYSIAPDKGWGGGGRRGGGGEYKNIFLISAQNICCGYSLEVPWQGTSNEYHNTF